MAAGTIWDVLTKLNTAKNYADIQPVIADLMEKVSGMHRDNQLLSEKVGHLEAEIAKSKDFSAQAERYRTNTEDTGVVTRVLKAPADANEQSHRFCPNCFQNSKVRYLQPTKQTELIQHLRGWFRVHNCHECGANLTFHRTANYDPSPQRPDRDHSPYY